MQMQKALTNAWVKTPPKYPANGTIDDYFRESFYLTISGDFRPQTFVEASLRSEPTKAFFLLMAPSKAPTDRAFRLHKFTVVMA